VPRGVRRPNLIWAQPERGSDLDAALSKRPAALRTPAYGRDDNEIGTAQRVMIDKISGKSLTLSCRLGGFLGVGEGYYPKVRY
jgi:hypothetical protein